MSTACRCMSIVLIALVFLPCTFASSRVPITANYEALIPAPGTYSVEIIRDRYGVPHIYGKTDADVAYGLGWAATEDDFKHVSETFLMARGDNDSNRRAESCLHRHCLSAVPYCLQNYWELRLCFLYCTG